MCTILKRNDAVKYLIHKVSTLKKSSLSVCFLLIILCPVVFAQNVGIGTVNPHASALLDLSSNNKGMSLPSMTSAQRTAIVNPKTGLLVFDTERNTICMFNGTNWVYFQAQVEPNLIHPLEGTAADGDVGDEFGSSVAINGNYVVVGAPGDNIGSNSDQGSAYIFFYDGSNWIQQAKLLAADGTADDVFGFSVSISGNTVVIGAYQKGFGANTKSGCAYVFVRSGTSWVQQAKLVAANAQIGDRFGYSVCLSGEYIVIGAPGDDIGADADEGSVYFFARSGVSWTQQDNRIAPFGAAGDVFGTSVSVDGNYAVVGAPADDNNGANNNGSIHIYMRAGSAWSFQQSLYHSPTDQTLFGGTVAIKGAIITTGFGSFSVTGGIKTFARNGSLWNTADIFNGSSFNMGLTTSDGFGSQVSTTGIYTLVGAAEFDGSNGRFDMGAAYLFKTDMPGGTWYFLRQILDPIGGYAHLAGYSVAISDNFSIIGAIGANGSKGKVLFLRNE